MRSPHHRPLTFLSPASSSPIQDCNKIKIIPADKILDTTPTTFILGVTTAALNLASVSPYSGFPVSYGVFFMIFHCLAKLLRSCSSSSHLRRQSPTTVSFINTLIRSSAFRYSQTNPCQRDPRRWIDYIAFTMNHPFICSRSHHSSSSSFRL